MNSMNRAKDINFSNDREHSEEFREVLETVDENFPQLTEPVELCMSTIATLLLEDLDKCPTVFLEGKPAVGKTTNLKFSYPEKSFENGFKWSYKSDDFTAASFVSNDASKTEEELEEIDLLPRIQDKVFLTPDVNTVFNRGDKDSTRKVLSRISRVLDGEGLSTDSGTHGEREQTGDYKFVWIGATTPLKESQYQAMGNLGSRILMIPVEENKNPTETTYEIMFGNVSYNEKVEKCRKKVSGFLNNLFEKYGIREVVFNTNGKSQGNSQELVEKMLNFGKFIIDWRNQDNPDNGGIEDVGESPKRVVSLLTDIARGHALLNGRDYLKEEDIDSLLPLVYGSVPKLIQESFKVLMKNREITRKDLQNALGASKPTANSKLDKLETLGLIDTTEKKVRGGSMKVGTLIEDYQWITKL